MAKKKKDFLDFLIESVPEAEVPPFFAQRVAARAFLEQSSLIQSLQAVSRQLLPVFLGLLIVASFFVLQVHFREDANPAGVELLFDQQEAVDEITIDQVITQLAEPERNP